jgi:hypothetical protein
VFVMASYCFGCRWAAAGFVPLQLAILADSRSSCLSAESIATGLLPKKFITLWKWRLWPPFSMTMLLYTFNFDLFCKCWIYCPLVLQRLLLCWRARGGVPISYSPLFWLYSWSCEVPKLHVCLTIPLANGVAVALLQCWHPLF